MVFFKTVAYSCDHQVAKIVKISYFKGTHRRKGQRYASERFKDTLWGISCLGHPQSVVFVGAVVVNRHRNLTSYFFLFFQRLGAQPVPWRWCFMSSCKRQCSVLWGFFRRWVWLNQTNYYQMWSFSKSNFNHLNLTCEKILQNLTSSQTSFFFLNSLFHYSSGNKQTKKQIENYLTKNGCFVQLLSCSSQTHERQRCVFKSCCRPTKEKKRKKQKKLSRLWVPALVKPTHVKVVLPPSPSALPSDRMPMWF